MKCSDCSDFDKEDQVCNCPFNALPPNGEGDYRYVGTTAESPACFFLTKI
jgi:hypothetical protein